MKYIYYSSVVFALLFSSCSRQASLTKTNNKQPNTVAYKPVTDTAITITAPKPAQGGNYVANPKDYYEDAYVKLKRMLEGIEPVSFKNAVYTTENAWFENKLSYNAFDSYIKALAIASKAWKKANPLLNYNWEADSTNVALNGAIYHIMSDTVKDEMGNIVTIPYHYDFNDCSAHDQWANMFVTKLMVTHGGNCHSLPFLYKMIAEELGTKAYLSFLPQHIYINQYSQKTSWYNTELTGKCFPVDAWLMTTGYVSVQSIRTGLYMDTLTLKQSITVCLNDLAKGYQRKFNDTDYSFILKCCELGLSYYPNYGELLLLKAETLKKLYQKNIELYGLNAPESKEHGKELKDIYDNMEQTYNTLAKLDYREIPDALYDHWAQAMINGGSTENENIHDTVVTTNVYGAFGKKLDMIAVSNGKYVELFENDTLRRIGSVIFNNITHKVEYFILKDDEKYSAALNRPTEPSRFLSVDPKASEFEDLSPYHYANNNPIRYTDVNGEGPGDKLVAAVLGSIDDIFGTNTRASYTPKDPQDYNTALNYTDAVMFVGGLLMVDDGTGKAAAGIIAAPETDGASLILTGEGLVEVEAGATISSHAIHNLGNNNYGEEKSTTQAQNKDDIKEDSKKNQTDRTSKDKLRTDKDGNPKPDPEAKGTKHTQLGTQKGRKGSYTKGREFDEHGNPVTDIEHTDHGRPQNHTNPHQHKYTKNKTGGTPQRGKAEPLNPKQ